MKAHRWVGLAVTLLLLASSANAQEKLKILFHVDSQDPARLEMTFHNVHSVEMHTGKKNVRMVVVANGPAVKLFLKNGSEKIDREIKDLVTAGNVEFHVCATSLRAFGYKPSDVLADCQVVPAGVIDIAHLESLGYAYIKP